MSSALLPAGASVTVRAPATVANIGPGFDCLGVALPLYNTLRVILTDQPSSVTVEGYGSDEIGCATDHFIVNVMRTAWRDWGVIKPARVAVHCTNRIPFGSGLGSSAAAIASGLVAARALMVDAAQPTDQALIDGAAALEGHGDNSTAALVGGFTVYGPDGQWVSLPVHPHVLWLACRTDQQHCTSAARSVLTKMVARDAAVRNIALVAGLAWAVSHDAARVGEWLGDAIHQDVRLRTQPRSAAGFEALQRNGYAVALAGSGPSLLVVADRARGQLEEHCTAVRTVLGPHWQVDGYDALGAGALTQVEPTAS